MGILVMLSGGVDSAALFAVKRDAPIVGAVLVQYAQPAYTQEWAAAREIARRVGVPLHQTMVPQFGIGAMGAPNGEAGPRVVPGRNLMLASLGVAHAADIGANEVWLGCIRDDNGDYPDCRPAFWTALSIATQAAYGVRVSVPLVGVTKAGTVEMAAGLGLLDVAWSCYTPSAAQPCGTCNSCRSRDAAVERRHRLGMVP